MKLCTPEQVDNLCVIHYGSAEYISKRVNLHIENSSINKPRGGLWASPVNSSHSWKDWCEAENYSKCENHNSFKLKFKSNAKILIIDNLEDLMCLPISEMKGLSCNIIDFKILSKEYDVIWLTAEGECKTRYSHPLNLYGWDVETVLIFNPQCCYQIKNYKNEQKILQGAL